MAGFPVTRRSHGGGEDPGSLYHRGGKGQGLKRETLERTPPAWLHYSLMNLIITERNSQTAAEEAFIKAHIYSGSCDEEN